MRPTFSLLTFFLCLASLFSQEQGSLLDDYQLNSVNFREAVPLDASKIVSLGTQELKMVEPLQELERYAGLNTLIAYAYSSLGKPDSMMECLTWLDDPLFKEIQYPERMVGLMMKGEFYLRAEPSWEGHDIFLAAESIAKLYHDDYYEASASSSRGLALYLNGLENEGLNLMQASADAYLDMGNIKQALHVQSNLAAFQIRSGAYQLALQSIDEILSHPDSLLGFQSHSFASSNEALCNIRLENFSKVRKSIEIGREVAENNNFALGRLYSLCLEANYLMEIGKEDSAGLVLEKIEVLDSTNVIQRATDLRSYLAGLKGRYYEYLSDYERARVAYLEAAQYAIPGSKFPDFAEAYEGLHRVAISMGDPEETERVFVELNQARDVLLGERAEARLRLFESNKLVEKQKEKLDDQQQELQAQNLYRQRLIIALVGISLLFIIFFLVYRNRDIKRSREKTEASNLKLSAYTKELEELAFVVSHNLRESARNISTYTGLFSREVGDQISTKGQTYLKYMYQASLRTSEMLGDLETYVGIGNHLQEGKSVNLNQVWEKVLSTKRTEMEPLEIQVRKDNLPAIKGHSAMLELLFTELLDNSVTYRNGDSVALTISSKRDGNCHKISFSDNGIGFSEVYKEKIFRVFQRLHSNEEIPGTGIGLPIVDKVIRLYGGKVEVKSEEGKGATFILMLPSSVIVG